MLLRAVPVLSALVLLAGCGSTPAPRTADAKPKAPPSTTAAPDEAAPARGPVTSLKRSEVKVTIARGVGYFLHDNQELDVSPSIREGKFHGFRIESIKREWGLDLRPGDVVTRVNGLPIERPEHAHSALVALEAAKALRVDYEREGKARTLELPIVEE